MNGFSGIDMSKVEEMKKEILQLMKHRCKNNGDAIHFENVNINDVNDNEGAIIAYALSEIVKADRRFAIVMWPTGPSLVKQADVDSINSEDRKLDDRYIITNADIDMKL